GIAPIQVESLGWFAVYGHVLVATWMLLFLRDVARLHAGVDRLGPRMEGRWLFLVLAAATSFGVGLGIALAFWAIVALAIPPSMHPRPVAKRFPALMALFPPLYPAQLLAYHPLFDLPVPGEPVSVFHAGGARMSSEVALVFARVLAGFTGFGITNVL